MQEADQRLPHDMMVRILHLNRAFQNAMSAALTREGLQDVGQPRLLMLLGQEDEEGGLPAQLELAQRLRVSPATVAASLSSLERMGYVVRREDLKDRRKKRIAITEKGRRAKERCFAIFRQIDAQLSEGITDEELLMMQELTQRMMDNLAKIGGRLEHDCCRHETERKDAEQ